VSEVHNGRRPISQNMGNRKEEDHTFPHTLTQPEAGCQNFHKIRLKVA
jgi:hypothetical protein